MKKINSRLGDKIDITDIKAEYDKNVKLLLSEKIILAHILVYAVKEYKGMNPVDVIELINGDPEIGIKAVNPGESNAPDIVGENTESVIVGEGKIYYDIKFRALAPSKKELIQLIIDVEAQKDYYPGYDLIARGVFYGARLISSQMGTEFAGDDYDKIKKVYSIWICMNVPKYAQNTITEYGIQKRDILGDFPDKGRYDLMSIIMVRLSKELAEATDETKLHRLLGTLLSNQMTRSEKKTIIETEYEIPITHEIERRVNQMCNLSDSIEEKGIEKGKELGKSEGIRVLVESCQDFGKTKEETMAHVAQKYEIAIEKVKEYIDMYWK